MSNLRWFLKRIRSAGLRRLRRLTGRGGLPVAKTLPGRVLRARSPEHGDRLYYVDKGRRHWIGNGDWLDRNGFDWSTDVTSVTPDILSGFLNGGMAPTYNRSDLGKPNLGSVDMREIAASRLRGMGLEFGAGASPFPVPLDCDVRFADAFAYESLIAALYPGQQAHDLIRPDYVTDIKTLAGIPDASLDFIVACHVIEHTNNPIAAIGSCHRALKPGGSVVLVVPDMTRTFDSKRALTTLAHLIEDYESPSLERDRGHYEEFYAKAFEIPAGSNLPEYAARKQAEGGDIHYHTWTYESFGELVDWCVQHQGWSVEFAHPTLAGPDDIEFYFVLTR
jgi:SAM-dependent methyltransferase